jgi:adenylate kinase family enzyme
LVEEFGYTHISTGDLMRAEIAKVKSSMILKLVAYQSVGLQRGRRNQEDC